MASVQRVTVMVERDGIGVETITFERGGDTRITLDLFEKRSVCFSVSSLDAGSNARPPLQEERIAEPAPVSEAVKSPPSSSTPSPVVEPVEPPMNGEVLHATPTTHLEGATAASQKAAEGERWKHYDDDDELSDDDLSRKASPNSKATMATALKSRGKPKDQRRSNEHPEYYRNHHDYRGPDGRSWQKRPETLTAEPLAVELSTPESPPMEDSGSATVGAALLDPVKPGVSAFASLAAAPAPAPKAFLSGTPEFVPRRKHRDRKRKKKTSRRNQGWYKNKLRDIGGKLRSPLDLLGDRKVLLPIDIPTPSS